MTSMLSIVWDFNPVMVSIGGFEIRYYSLMWAAALFVGGWIFSYFCKKEGRPQELSDSAFLYIALGTMIGARVGHCLFYEPEYYLLKPWAIITEIRNGGLASHGATIGIITAIWLCSRKNRVPVMWMTDRLGVIAPISGALIRFGNLFNSEIIGHQTDMPWGFKFMRLYKGLPAEQVPACHPTQLYEALCYIATFLLLWWMYHKTEAPRRRGLLFGVALIGIFLTRFFIEFVKVNQVAFEEGMSLNMGQWLSLPFVAIGIASVWYALSRPAVVDDKKSVKLTKK
jgi:prolipoprotein diacylglyceryl transferase